jgi:hypothetical protein
MHERREAKATQKRQIDNQSAESNGEDGDAPAANQMFSRAQTTILQRWFLDNIEHPYVRKTEKQLLATKTGLTMKQITGWLMNNRKRKYQRLVKIAQDKGKGMEYVKEVMKLKFNRDLDKSFSDGSSNRSITDSENCSAQGLVSRPAPPEPERSLFKAPQKSTNDLRRENLMKLLGTSGGQESNNVTPDKQAEEFMSQIKATPNVTPALPTTVSMSGNGSGSSLSKLSRELIGRHTFIPIIYTDAMIDHTTLDESFFQRVKPIMPIEA